MLSAQMLSGIPEVDLGIEAKIQEKIGKSFNCKLKLVIVTYNISIFAVF